MIIFLKRNKISKNYFFLKKIFRKKHEKLENEKINLYNIKLNNMLINFINDKIKKYLLINILLIKLIIFYKLNLIDKYINYINHFFM